MRINRSHFSEEDLAKEAFSVLLCNEKPTRSLSKAQLISELTRPEIRMDFLKLSLEWDDSPELWKLRRALSFVIKAVGPTNAAKFSGVPRVTLYRMFSKRGNPSFSNLLKVLHALGLKFWLVDQEFIHRSRRFLGPLEDREMGINLAKYRRNGGLGRLRPPARI